MSITTVLKLAVWGICVAITLQVIFYFIFQMIGYNSYLLSITLLMSLTVAVLFLVAQLKGSECHQPKSNSFTEQLHQP
jgi:high-affinity Fe2+/Pb2+ permease